MGTKRAGVGASLGLLLASTGCLDYTVETTLAADGTGVRVERMEVTRNDEFSMSRGDFRALTLSEGRGWTTDHRVDRDGDTTWVAERRTEVRSLGAWSEPPRRTLLLGALPAAADRRVGYVRLGDVALRSSVQVGVTRRSDGTSVVAYRERFSWDQAVDAMVEFILRDLDRSLRERYPRLSEGERGAVVGFARARIWVAGEEGLFSGGDEDETIARAAEVTARHAVKILRVKHPEAKEEDLRRLLTGLLALEGDDVERSFLEILPGLNLGFNTNMVVRLTLPGTVGENNAGRRDGNTLEWEFSPLDDLTASVEIFAEALVGR